MLKLRNIRLSVTNVLVRCFFWLGIAGYVVACQTEPQSHVLTPTLTVYAQEPEHPAARKAQPISSLPNMQGVAPVYVPGGFTQIGDETGPEAEKPVFWVEVKPFLMDEHPVTVAEFRRFVTATKYITEADRFGDAGVFDDKTKAWTLTKKVNWEYPQGRDKKKAPDNHPVTQVSWNDATAYATWAGKRLPHEFEWEHAARNAINSRSRYPFGNELQNAQGRYLANTWNGTFPDNDAVADGFHYTSPVGYFGKTPLGLTDMTGNVWEWCANGRQSYTDVIAGQEGVKPTEKVQRGGSFLCEPGWCHGYRVSGRSFTSPETALMHVGFRCVKDVPD